MEAKYMFFSLFYIKLRMFSLVLLKEAFKFDNPCVVRLRLENSKSECKKQQDSNIRQYDSISTPCALRPIAYGSVCVCNVTYCDFLDSIAPNGINGFVLTSSSKMGLRFSSMTGQFSDEAVVVDDWGSQSNCKHESMVNSGNAKSQIQPKGTDKTVTIKIDRKRKFQKIVGFGGALTTAVSYNLGKLPQKLQDFVYQSFYSRKGISFTIIRMPIGACDFDLEPWAYNEEPEDDLKLSNFTKLNNLDEIKGKQIVRLKLVSNLKELKIMGAAWSPPRWMKTNHAWSGLSRLIEKYYQTWADYHLRFIELMHVNKMPMWAISTGNEPNDGLLKQLHIPFVSLGWVPKQQAVWVADNLGPTIRNSKFKNVKIFCNDDQRFSFPSWFKEMNKSRSDSVQYLDGLSSHVYLDPLFSIDLIDEAHQLMPDKLLFSSESSTGSPPRTSLGPNPGSWERGEVYMHDLFHDLHHMYNGYVDWNLLLNEKGGPNYAHNYVDSPIMANTTSGQEIYKQPIFYVLGHFSKFIPEGSIRIVAETSNSNISTVAFERPNDATISCIFYNSEQTAIVVSLVDSVRGKMEITIPPKSLHTIEYH